MAHTLSEAALVFLASAGVCLVVGPAAIRWLARTQCLQPDRYQDCPPLQAHQTAKQGTPTMGGLFVLLSAGLVAGAAGGLIHPEGRLIALAIAGLAAVGVFDDYLKFRGHNARGLRALPKLAVALGIGAGIGAAFPLGASSYQVVEIPWLHQAIDLGWLWIPFAMMVMAGCAHAVNLTDGLDGLAAGCVAIVLSILGLWALGGDPGSHALVPWCASLAGACVGFLWFNSHPASVFLGDVGSLGLGAAVGAISLLSHTALWLVIIGGVFVAEALSVMLQVASYKWRGKRRIFRVAPLHHHFHLGGVTEPKLIVRFWIVGLLLGMLGLTAIELP